MTLAVHKQIGGDWVKHLRFSHSFVELDDRLRSVSRRKPEADKQSLFARSTSKCHPTCVLPLGWDTCGLNAPCDPSPRDAVSSSLVVVISANELAQARLMSVNLVEGRKLMA